MYTGKVYRMIDMAKWTRYETFLLFGMITAWVCAYYFLDLHWLKIPWAPLALIGTAVAFVIGFQNNAVYGRIWEARKIWGGIVNTSRTFGVFVQDMLTEEHAKNNVTKEEIEREVRILTLRHIAWMTALRHSMRQQKPWETASEHKTNTEWGFKASEKKSSLKEDIKPYLSEQDMEYVMSKDNKQTAVLYVQSHHLRALKEKGIIWEFSFLELEGIVQELFNVDYGIQW